MIVAPGGAEVALAAKSATATIPIVFEMGGDPVALGVVSSLSRPGGNLTGVSSLSVEVSRKRLEFMREVRPDSKTFAVALNPTSPTSSTQLKNLQAAAETLGVELVVLKASTEQEFESALHRRASSRRRAAWSSAPIPISPSAASSLLRSRPAMPCRRSPSRATSRSPAA